MKEINLVLAHLNAYEGLVSKYLVQGMKIDEQLSATNNAHSTNFVVNMVNNAMQLKHNQLNLRCSYHCPTI